MDSLALPLYLFISLAMSLALTLSLCCWLCSSVSLAPSIWLLLVAWHVHLTCMIWHMSSGACDLACNFSTYGLAHLKNIISEENDMPVPVLTWFLYAYAGVSLEIYFWLILDFNLLVGLLRSDAIACLAEKRLLGRWFDLAWLCRCWIYRWCVFP